MSSLISEDLEPFYWNRDGPLHDADFEKLSDDDAPLMLTNESCAMRVDCTEEREHRHFFMSTQQDEELYSLTKIYEGDRGDEMAFECQTYGKWRSTIYPEQTAQGQTERLLLSEAFEGCLTQERVVPINPLSAQPQLWIFPNDNIASKNNSGIAIHDPPETLQPESMAPGLVQALNALTGETDIRSRKITMEEWRTEGGTLPMLDPDQNEHHWKVVDLKDLIETVTLSADR
ncbi:hypothetical protein TREMEDRAFT_63732 [Tremella mesenterica DSM 1558]|uniref:uncharacterized protein n=1 Tax=Tremella mesenterica (strain ATCC 24925 / CBS 8224 / DSM 1558 / NBRC 9311 / NRRL Y-6157 / RJB 2259-6 / UBC 559-6) TaxID=578456 RepID=UPI0003F49CF3|nr:uncharacterized protein TREMEDRAFT_63732 [Tremella mesenterica DSM 1558]EIW67841.1 hypothetical protein TREMEDRAFT_63732 [Tremella mesenterica DSM 1558]